MRIVAAIVFLALIVIRLLEGGLFGGDPASESSAVHTAGNYGDSAMDSDLGTVDGYLADWDRFAQGADELIPKLRREKPEFDAALARLLAGGDRRAPARFVFYAVVQVGGSYRSDSEVGQAAQPILGANFPITVREDDVPLIFAGDLYYWWQMNGMKYEPYPLFDEWLEREYAQTTVIPLYENLRQTIAAQ